MRLGLGEGVIAISKVGEDGDARLEIGALPRYYSAPSEIFLWPPYVCGHFSFRG
jgi:hypothetical protein